MARVSHTGTTRTFPQGRGMAIWILLLMHHHYRLVLAGPDPRLLAVTDTGTRSVTLYAPQNDPPALLRKILAYEGAHVLDVDCLTDRQRRTWQRLRHLSGRWYAPNYAPENGYGSGDFADVVSLWAAGPAYFQSAHRPARRDLATLAHRFHFRRLLLTDSRCRASPSRRGRA